MSDRYFVESPLVSDRAVLAGAEAHHLLHVMRAGWELASRSLTARAGNSTPSSSGSGRSEVELAIAGRQEIDREAPIAVTLGVALPKGDRQKWLVEKLVELGVARLAPLETERGVAQPVENALQRLRRGVIEASKQCGRNRLMEIAEPKTWRKFLAESGDTACRLVAHPAGQPDGGTHFTRPTLLQNAAIAIGPEGGFTDEEVAQAVAQGWQAVDLGPRILRVETAALALAALLIG